MSLSSDFIVGFPGETEEDFAATLALVRQIGYAGAYSFKYSPRPNTPALQLDDAIPDEEKALRLAILMERQRDIQKRRNERHLGQNVEVMVEGRNDARHQWIGRTSQNKTANFVTNNHAHPVIGTYVPVLITGRFPNSLLGELVI